jgi:hypothetical protein
MAPSGTLFTRSLADALEDPDFFAAGGLMPARLDPGAPRSRVVVATGGNACGKTFFAKVLDARLARRRKLEGIGGEGEFFHIGMSLRASAGGCIGPKTFVYGDETSYSTGATSARVVRSLIENSRRRESRHVVALDEPEIGLADEYAMALADRIAAYAARLPPLCDALVVASHCRPFVARLLDLRPHCVRFGPGTTREWIASEPAPASQEDLEALADRNIETFRAIHRVLQGRKAQREAGGPGRCM